MSNEINAYSLIAHMLVGMQDDVVKEEDIKTAFEECSDKTSPDKLKEDLVAKYNLDDNEAQEILGALTAIAENEEGDEASKKVISDNELQSDYGEYLNEKNNEKLAALDNGASVVKIMEGGNVISYTKVAGQVIGMYTDDDGNAHQVTRTVGDDGTITLEDIAGGQTTTKTIQYNNAATAQQPAADNDNDNDNNGSSISFKGKSADKIQQDEAGYFVLADKWSASKDDNIDCTSRLINNIYGVKYNSDEGKEIIEQLKKLNPDLVKNGEFSLHPNDRINLVAPADAPAPVTIEGDDVTEGMIGFDSDSGYVAQKKTDNGDGTYTIAYYKEGNIKDKERVYQDDKIISGTHFKDDGTEEYHYAYEYDDTNNTKTYIRYNPGDDNKNIVYKETMDSSGVVQNHVDYKLNDQGETLYDANNQPVAKEEQIYQDGKLVSGTHFKDDGTEEDHYTYEYDDTNNTITRKCYNPGANNQNIKTLDVTDNNTGVCTVTDYKLNDQGETLYDANNQPILDEQQSYQEGRIVSGAHYKDDGTEEYHYTYEYDDTKNANTCKRYSPGGDDNILSCEIKDDNGAIKKYTDYHVDGQTGETLKNAQGEPIEKEEQNYKDGKLISGRVFADDGSEEYHYTYEYDDENNATIYVHYKPGEDNSNINTIVVTDNDTKNTVTTTYKTNAKGETIYNTKGEPVLEKETAEENGKVVSAQYFDDNGDESYHEVFEYDASDNKTTYHYNPGDNNDKLIYSESNNTRTYYKLDSEGKTELDANNQPIVDKEYKYNETTNKRDCYVNGKVTQSVDELPV